MKLKNKLLCLLIAGASTGLDAQNTFPGTGGVGIGTLAPGASLHIAPSAAYNGNALQIDSWSDPAGARTGEIRLMEVITNGTNYVGLKAPSNITTSEIYTLPSADGTSGQFLSTDGNGNLSWTSAAKGANKKLSNLTAPTTIYVDLLPGNDNSKDLGSSAYSWNELYLDGDVYLDGSRFIHNSDAILQTTGLSAGINNTTGFWNTFSGYQSGYTNTSGSANTFFGTSTGYSNTTGYANTFIGSFTGYGNTVGANNTFIGGNSGTNNASSSNNTAIGANSFSLNTDGHTNIALGSAALYNNTSGDSSIAIGYRALYTIDTENSNIAVGNGSMEYISAGNNNIAIGNKSLQYGDAEFSIAIGENALASPDVNASQMIAIGSGALQDAGLATYSIGIGTRALQLGGGWNNVAIGSYSQISNMIGGGNASLGTYALAGNVWGSSNVGVGAYAGQDAYENYNCTLLGAMSDFNVIYSTFSNSTALGYYSRITADEQVRVGNSSTLSIGGYVGWTNISDGRYKENITEDVPGLEFINKLTPVTYTLNIAELDAKLSAVDTSAHGKSGVDKGTIRYTGFIAQDVEAAARELNYEFSGVDAPKNDNDLYGLRYAEFVVPLTKAVQELSSLVEEKDEELAVLNEKLNAWESTLELLQAEIKSLKETSGIPASNQATVIIQDGQNSAILLENAWLEQNTPNPFAGSTQIRCFVPQSALQAELVVHSNSGVLMYSGRLQSGLNNITVDALSLTSGTYHYSLIIDGLIIDSKSMILTK